MNVYYYSSATSLVEENSYWVDDHTVYYNPIDGTELGAEEKSFLADHLEAEYNITE